MPRQSQLHNALTCARVGPSRISGILSSFILVHFTRIGRRYVLLDDLFDATLGREPGHSTQEDINRRRLGDTGQRVRELEQRFERLKVDLADGTLDGKMDRKGSAMDCPGCNRRILRSASVCPWCGHRAESGNAFEGM